jgi:DNA-binding NarL/FixJ family response regulator
MTTIKVLLVDDHRITLTGIRYSLKRATDIVIVAEARSGRETLDLIDLHQPDIVLLDIEMPDMSGLEVIKHLKERAHPVRCLILSGHDSPQYIREALADGAWGYLTKDITPRQLVEAVRGVAKGKRGWLSQRAALRMAADPGNLLDNLTTREQDVLRLIAAGKTNYDIGRALDISEKTVEKHVSEILKKLDLQSRVDAAVLAERYGIFKAHDD